MKIHFQRTGGFGGTKIESTIDCDALGSEDACRLRSLLDEAGLLAGGEGREEIPGGAGEDHAEPAPRDHEPRGRDDRGSSKGSGSSGRRVDGRAPRAPNDAFCYRVTVEGREGSRSVEVEEGSIDETLERLVEWLTARARASRRGSGD